jgi:hypothetical protein
LIHAVRLAWGLTVAGAALGFLASVGVFVLPPLAPSAVVWLAPTCLLLGLAGGLAARRRGVDIDRRRWEIVADSRLTSGEREYAHKEAERERRLSATALLAGPLAVGYWAAYQAAGDGSTVWTQLLPLWPLAGFGAGWWLGRKGEPPPPDPDRSTDR